MKIRMKLNLDSQELEGLEFPLNHTMKKAYKMSSCGSWRRKRICGFKEKLSYQILMIAIRIDGWPEQKGSLRFMKCDLN